MRAIDADKLIEELEKIEDREHKAIFVNKIIKMIEQQPALEQYTGGSEVVITAKAWDELPVDIKAGMITRLKSAMVITGYAQSL